MTSAYQNTNGAEVPVKLTPAGAVPVTLSGETITMPAEVEIKNDTGNPVPVSGPLTDTQLRATAVPVSVPARTCTGRQTLSVTTGAVVTLTVPANSLAAAIQADGNSVSITLDGTTPTASVGTRIDDGVIYYVDTALANVKLIARTATTNVQVVYFDKA